MATTFTGLRVQNTYNAILKIGDNSNLSGTAKILSDGVGNSSSIYLSTTRFGIGITPAYQFHTSGNAKIGGNLIISGDLTVNGTLTYLNVEDLAVEDPLIKLAKDNTANTLDIGFFGKYVATGTKYKGLFNDASDDKFKLFIGTSTEPTTTVDTTASGYTVGTLVANLEGNVTGTVSSLSNHDTNDLLEGSTNLYFTTARARASFSAGDGITITNGVIASEGDAEVAKRIDVTVKNVSGTTLAKGVVVHAAPTATPPSGNVIEVVPADANVSANMPAIGVLNETIADESEGEAVMFGAVSGINTSSFSVGDELYVSETAGEFTATKPTAFTSQVQKIAVVIKSHASNGLIKVFGAGRSNDIPNRVNRDMNFTDGSKLLFGNDSDLEIYYDGTDGYIDNINGELIIQNNSNDKKIIFKSDNGIGGITEYFRVDGNINRNIISVTTQLNDDVPLIFGNGAGRPSIKYNSTSSQLLINGESKFLNDLYSDGSATFLGDVFIGATGTTPKVDMLFLTHSSGPKWDTRTFIGKSNDLPGGAGEYPTYESAGSYGIQFQSNSDGAFFGIEDYGNNQFRPVINWGDDNTDSPFRFKFKNSPIVTIDYLGNITAPEIITTSGNPSKFTSGGIRSKYFAIYDGATTQVGGLYMEKTITGSGTSTSTVLFAEGGDNIQFATNGSTSPKMIIDTDGKVAINETNPLAKLTVNQNSLVDTEGIMVQSGGNPGNGGVAIFKSANLLGSISALGSNSNLSFMTDSGTERMKIKSDGNIYINNKLGIGLTNPSNLLHIKGTGDAIRVESTNTGVGGAQIDLLHFTTSPADNDTFGLINMGGYYSGTSSAYGTSIKSIWTDVSARNSDLSFLTSQGTLSEKMRITSGARINMDVMATQASEGVIRIGRYDANTSRYNEIQNSVTSNGAGSYMNLCVHSGTENVVTNVMTLLGSGNVGIGDTSPDYRLTVAKTSQAAPAFMVSGAYYGGPRIQTYGLDADSNAWMGLGTDMSGAAYEHSIYFPDYNSNGRLTIGTYNGTTYSTKMVVLRSGNVGIGTSSFASDHILQIHNSSGAFARFALTNSATGTGSADGLRFQMENLNSIIKNTENGFLGFGTNGRESDIRINSYGNVGIGTASPTARLDVLTNSATGNNGIDRHVKFRADNGEQRFDFFVGRSGNSSYQGMYNSSEVKTVNISTSGISYFNGGNVGIGTTLPLAKLDLGPAGGIKQYVYCDGGNVRAGFGVDLSGSSRELSIFHSSSNSVNGNISFGYRYESTGAYYERMRVQGDGKVGIGTTSPTRELHVQNASDNAIISAVSGTSRISGLVLGDTADDDRGAILYNNSSDYLYFQSNGSESLRIDSSNNIGIGTGSNTIFTYGSSALTNVQITNTSYSTLTHQTTGSSANWGVWRNIVRSNGVYQLQTLNDSGTGEQTAFEVNRSGTTITKVLFPNGKVGINTTTGLAKLVVNQNSYADTEGIWVQSANDPGEGGVAIFKSANKVGSISALGGNSNLSFMTSSSTTRMYINSVGNIGINDTTPSYKLDVNGTIRATSDVIAFSDKRVKENIFTIDNALNKINKLRGVTYTRKDKKDKSTKIGVIAQEVLKVLPEVVSKDDEGMYSVAYGNMAGVFIEAIKELENRIKELENKPCNCKCK